MLGKVRYVCSAQMSFDGEETSVNLPPIVLYAANDVRFMNIKNSNSFS